MIKYYFSAFLVIFKPKVIANFFPNRNDEGSNLGKQFCKLRETCQYISLKNYCWATALF